MRFLGSSGRACLLLGVLAFAPLLASCDALGPCQGVNAITAVILHIAPERAANLATLRIELCQDGGCHSLSVDAAGAPTSSPAPLPTPSAAVRAVPRRMADGSIDVTIDTSFNNDPLDVTTSGTDSAGVSIGTSHLTLILTTKHPDGPACGGPTTAKASLDLRGLQEG